MATKRRKICLLARVFNFLLPLKGFHIARFPRPCNLLLLLLLLQMEFRQKSLKGGNFVESLLTDLVLVTVTAAIRASGTALGAIGARVGAFPRARSGTRSGSEVYELRFGRLWQRPGAANGHWSVLNITDVERATTLHARKAG